MTDMTDPRPFHRRAVAQTGSIVAAVRPGQLALPTPCSDYDVRALLGHTIGGLDRVAWVGAGAAGSFSRSAGTGDVADDGWTAAYHASAERAVAAWTDDAKLEEMFEVPWGKVPGRYALAGDVQEVLVHGWDLAKATGQPTELDAELGSWVLAQSRQILPADRSEIQVPFGAAIDVPQGAGIYAQLAAWLGRQP